MTLSIFWFYDGTMFFLPPLNSKNKLFVIFVT